MFKSPFSIQGRIRRTEFAISALLYSLLYAIMLNWYEESGINSVSFRVILMIPLLWFMLAQNAKRCHDLGRSGWWQFIPFYFLWLIFAPGQREENRYGSNPGNYTEVEVIFEEARNQSAKTGTGGGSGPAGAEE